MRNRFGNKLQVLNMNWLKRFKKDDEKLVEEAVRLSETEADSKTNWKVIALWFGALVLAILLYEAAGAATH